MPDQPKTRAERVAEAYAHPLIGQWRRSHEGKTFRDAGATQAILRLLDALALPPDPPQPQDGALRDALVKVVAHTGYLPGAPRELLKELLDSCRRIADAALLAAPAPAEPEPCRRGPSAEMSARAEFGDDKHPEPVADAERERRVAEWMRRITVARVNNDTPAFDRAVLDAIDIMRERDAEVARLRALYSLVANCAIQIDNAENDNLPSKAESFRDEMLKLLADYAPNGGEFTKLAAEMRGRTWNSEMVKEAQEEVARLRAEITRLSGQSGSCAECERLAKERDAGWEALERLRDRMTEGLSIVLPRRGDAPFLHSMREAWESAIALVDKALAARPAQGKEGA